MTQTQFNKQFKLEYPNYEVMTLTDRRLYYNGLIETYRQCDLITDKQAESWGHPKFLQPKRDKINCSAY
jgi:hypothetical protein